MFPFWFNKSEVEKKMFICKYICKNTYFIVLFIVGKKNFLALLHIFRYHAIPLSPIRGGKKLHKICRQDKSKQNMRKIKRTVFEIGT